jgi:hypothetical protein
MAKKRGLLGKITGAGKGYIDSLRKRDRDRDYILNNGLDGTAAILDNQGHYAKTDEGAPARAYGDDERWRYLFRIEVADGREPYELGGNWFIPGYHKGREWLRFLEEGMTLPVKVVADKPDEVAIDWDAFEANGGKTEIERRQAEREAEMLAQGQVRSEAQTAKWLGRFAKAGMISPEQAAQMQQAAASAGAGPTEEPPPLESSPRETLDWQLHTGVIDQATYDAILANSPNL